MGNRGRASALMGTSLGVLPQRGQLVQQAHAVVNSLSMPMGMLIPAALRDSARCGPRQQGGGAPAR